MFSCLPGPTFCLETDTERADAFVSSNHMYLIKKEEFHYQLLNVR